MNEPTAPAPIRPLPGVLVNQIAAGEIVERPASVVKELVENALDAASTKIDIELEIGGMRLLRVRDDGLGIDPGEFKLALSRHATSKIATLDDLDRITSMGFRGEALPSIASVSRFTLESRSRAATAGARLQVEGGVFGAVEPAALKIGTTVEVRDLFFNVPARRKFLRTPRTELRHIEDTVRQLALAHPDVSFTLRHDARTLIDTTRHMTPMRQLSRLLGPEFTASAFEIAYAIDDLSIHGFLTSPSAARTRPDHQFLSVNGRSVRDNVVRHAVRVGYGDTLADSGHPGFVLHLNIAPTAVDINVHPTKHEVRFREPRLIHDFVRHAVSRTLSGEFAAMPSPEPAGSGDTGLPETVGILLPEAAASAPVPVDEILPDHARIGEGHTPYFARSAMPRAAESSRRPGHRRARLGQYVVVERETGLLLIELGAGLRALVHDRLDDSTQTRPPIARPLLIPQSLAVAEAVADRVEEAIPALQALGIEIRRSAPDVITLRAIPVCLTAVAAEKLIEAVIKWTRSANPMTQLIDELAALVGSNPTDDDIDDVIEAAIGNQLSAGAVAIEETMLHHLFTTARRR